MVSLFLFLSRLSRRSTADIGATLIDELSVPAEAATLRVWTQRCRGGHDGLAFNDAADAACFERLVLGGRRFACSAAGHAALARAIDSASAGVGGDHLRRLAAVRLRARDRRDDQGGDDGDRPNVCYG